MKDVVSMERITAARQRLAELLELGNGPLGSGIQERQAVRQFSVALDDLETVAT
jgi:hypothetical protein